LKLYTQPSSNGTLLLHELTVHLQCGHWIQIVVCLFTVTLSVWVWLSDYLLVWWRHHCHCESVDLKRYIVTLLQELVDESLFVFLVMTHCFVENLEICLWSSLCSKSVLWLEKSYRRLRYSKLPQPFFFLSHLAQFFIHYKVNSILLLLLMLTLQKRWLQHFIVNILLNHLLHALLLLKHIHNSIWQYLTF
jgi:hypothetical protein